MNFRKAIPSAHNKDHPEYGRLRCKEMYPFQLEEMLKDGDILIEDMISCNNRYIVILYRERAQQ